MFTVGECRGLHRRHVERRGVEVGEDFRVARTGRPPESLGQRLCDEGHVHFCLLGVRDRCGGHIYSKYRRGSLERKRATKQKVLTLRGPHRYQRVGNAVTFRMSYCSPSGSKRLPNGGGVSVSETYVSGFETHAANRPFI